MMFRYSSSILHREIIRSVSFMDPLRGITLEESAPPMLPYRETLKEEMDIPVFHDDQHGTAIISGAGLINAIQLAGKDIEQVKVVFNGAGAAGIACAKFYIALGVKPENVMLCDSTGVIYKGRTKGMNTYKEEFAVETGARTLEDALVGADVFAGISVANCVTRDMVRSMADRPIIFAMANPDPEITYPEAIAARDDLIMATGRSDFPNQINNVLGFPGIFRGALDVRARAINVVMKIAAAYALDNLAKEPVPYQVEKAYRGERLRFGPEYIIPKPFDPRVLIWEASAVAQAAMATGVARIEIDIDEYREALEARLGMSRKIMRVAINKARKDPKRIVFPEGDQLPVIKACETILDEGMAQPVLLGPRERIEAMAEEAGIAFDGAIEIIDPRATERHDRYEQEFYRMRQRKGVTLPLAHELMILRNYFGAMMVHLGEADGMVAGLTTSYADTLRPALQIIGARPDVRRVAGMTMVAVRGEIYCFADVSVTINPTAEELADIVVLCANAVAIRVEPRIARCRSAISAAPRRRKPRKCVTPSIWCASAPPDS